MSSGTQRSTGQRGLCCSSQACPAASEGEKDEAPPQPHGVGTGARQEPSIRRGAKPPVPTSPPAARRRRDELSKAAGGQPGGGRTAAEGGRRRGLPAVGGGWRLRCTAAAAARGGAAVCGGRSAPPSPSVCCRREELSKAAGGQRIGGRAAAGRGSGGGPPAVGGGSRRRSTAAVAVRGVAAVGGARPTLPRVRPRALRWDTAAGNARVWDAAGPHIRERPEGARGIRPLTLDRRRRAARRGS